MDEKITMQMLASMLAEKTGFSRKQCEDFLREFFVTVSDTLAKGENVKIKGLGSFRIINVASRRSVDVNTGESIEIPGHNKIVFAASKELAEEVNEPFSIFESVELDDSYDDTKAEAPEPMESSEPSEHSQNTQNTQISHYSQDSQSSESPALAPSEEEIAMQVKAATSEYVIADVEEEEVIAPEPEKESKEKSEPEMKEESEAEKEAESEPLKEKEADKEHEAENQIEAEEEIASETLRQAEEFEKPRRRRFSFLMGFAAGVAVMAVVLLGIWYFGLGASTDIFSGNGSEKAAQVSAPEVKSIETPAVARSVDSVVTDEAADKNVEVPTEASDQPVYDTISKTRYLTTMAKEHYGNYNLWPYIYEENKSFLGHPDRIRPGTKVVIPSLSKYGIDPNNPEDIKKAKRKGVEIYSKFK